MEEKESSGREDFLAGDGPGRFSDLLRELADAPLVSPKSDREPDVQRLPVVGRFRLARELGRGGGGITYEARDSELGRRVDVKLIIRGGGLPRALGREAEAAAQLSHPNIATLFDAGLCDRGPYLVREHLRGETLGRRMERGPVSAREALYVAEAVARGLAHAHAQGVLHRDLTPESVFLCSDGSVKVLDFGVASAYGRRDAEEGGLAYLAPEQEAGAEDERADVFSLGAMLYRMVSGALPFPGGATLPAQSGPSALPLAVPGSPALAKLIGRMVERDPLRRPRDGDEVLEALEAVRSSQRQERRSPEEQGRRPLRRWALVAALALASAVALAQRLVRPPAGASLAPKCVVVADFENPTGDRDLDGLAGLLIASLEQSKRLTVLTRTRVLDVARQSGRGQVDHVDAALGREVARKAGAEALLMPEVRRSGSSYVLTLDALDPLGGGSLFPLSLEAKSKDAILAAIDRLSDGVRRRLGEGDESIERQRVPVSEVAGTLEAYRHFFAGQQFYYRGEYGEAKKAYEKTLQVDPGFALAHLELHWLALSSSAGAEEIAGHLRAAERWADWLPEKHRKLVQLARANVEFEASGGREREPLLRLGEELAAAYPLDKDVLFTVARLIWEVHGEAGRARAAQLLQRILTLDPTRLDAAEKLIVHFIAARRCEEAVDLARSLASETGPVPPKLLAYSLACAGRAEEALAAARASAERGPGGEEALVYVLPAVQEYEEAEALLERLTSEAADPTTRRLYLHRRVRLLALRGRRKDALELMRRSAGMAGPLWDYTRRQASDSGEGMVLRVDSERDFPRDWDENRGLLPADRALKEGRVAEAIARYQSFIADLSLDARVVNDNYVAELLLREGRPAEALEQVGGPERSLLSLSPGAAARGFYLRALAYQRLGDRRRAAREIDQLFHLWAQADADLPLLSEARKLRSRLNDGLSGEKPEK